jgi:hypothetical protein
MQLGGHPGAGAESGGDGRLKDHPRSPRGHYLRAIEIWSIVQCPKIIKYRETCATALRVDFSDEELEYAIDIRHLAGKCDRTGYMRNYFEGLRWDQIPERWHGTVSADIRAYKRELRDGGYKIG